MKIRCGALSAERFPIAGKAVSWRVRPCESRAMVPVLVCTIRLPSASVRTDPFVIVAEYGAPRTGLDALSNAPEATTTEPVV
jgi:hypothetical protein